MQQVVLKMIQLNLIYCMLLECTHSKSKFFVCLLNYLIFASGAGDNTICLFEAGCLGSGDDSLNLGTFTFKAKKEEAHPFDINCVRWHPTDPKVLASAGDDGTIRLWGL